MLKSTSTTTKRTKLIRGRTRLRQIDFMSFLLSEGYTVEEIANVYKEKPSKVEAALNTMPCKRL